MKYQYPAAVYGAAFNAVAEANIQLLAAIGVKCNTEVQNYQSQYITHTFTGDFTGMAYGAQTPFLEGGAYLIRFFTPNPLNHGHINDQKLVDLTMKQQGQLDPKERRATFVEAQQYHASKMYYVPNAGAGTTYLGYREWMGGVEDVRTLSGSYGSGTEMYPFWWKTQA
jgi:ABC-type transport system substrate-binding protein